MIRPMSEPSHNLIQLTRETANSNVHPLIAARHSSRNYDPNRPLTRELLKALLKAAQAAPSSSNRQPWIYLVFDDSHPEALHNARACLNPDNQVWANRAPVLLLAVAEEIRPDGRKNGKALHDLGLANQNILLQAISMGLNARPMGGFDAQKARELFSIPPEFTPVIMIAVGYPGELEQLPEVVQEKERQPRTRKPLDQFTFQGEWGRTYLPE